jgi:hypothetical protein
MTRPYCPSIGKVTAAMAIALPGFGVAGPDAGSIAGMITANRHI